ncbi:hypothetical protein N9I21_03115 [Crocinitomicaceae bacterium]|jgi:hypothetical protein|nr:hypothetical protein [Crocinitomicaceae bacterium]
MRKVLNVLASLFVIGLLFSCGDASEEATKTSAAAGSEWDKLAKEAGLSKADVAKAIEIGTKMQACWVAESAPGAYDSHMTDDCDPFFQEFKEYCVQTFGSDDYNDEGDAGKKIQGFRDIMFATREK